MSLCAPVESSTPAGAQSSPELGDLLRRHAERYAATHWVSSIQHKVIRALSECRTAALGGHLEAWDPYGNRLAGVPTPDSLKSQSQHRSVQSLAHYTVGSRPNHAAMVQAIRPKSAGE